MKGTEITKQARKKVLERDSWEGCPCCVYCGNPSALHVHHVRRRSQGGQGEPENLVLLCVDCHTRLHAGDSEIQRFCENYLTRLYGGENEEV